MLRDAGPGADTGAGPAQRGLCDATMTRAKAQRIAVNTPSIVMAAPKAF
jgi:hypothetical protein